jgi:hypothetical protein
MTQDISRLSTQVVDGPAGSDFVSRTQMQVVEGVNSDTLGIFSRVTMLIVEGPQASGSVTAGRVHVLIVEGPSHHIPHRVRRPRCSVV